MYKSVIVLLLVSSLCYVQSQKLGSTTKPSRNDQSPTSQKFKAEDAMKIKSKDDTTTQLPDTTPVESEDSIELQELEDSIELQELEGPLDFQESTDSIDLQEPKDSMDLKEPKGSMDLHEPMDSIDFQKPLESISLKKAKDSKTNDPILSKSKSSKSNPATPTVSSNVVSSDTLDLATKSVELQESLQTESPDPLETMTPEERQSHLLYRSAMLMLNNSNTENVEAYVILEQAASIGHTEARRMIAIAHLFGDNGVHFQPELAREVLEELAAKGDPESQLYIGFMYSFGLGKEPSQAKAMIYYTFAAIGGSHLARMALGYRLSSGVGVRQSCEQSLGYYWRVAGIVEKGTSGHLPSATTVKVRLSDEYENPSRSPSNTLDDDLIQYYQFLADKGDVQAQVGLGHLHYQGGRGVQQDHTRALNYFTQAAKTGNANAMAYLGKMYLEGGKTIKQNNETAFRYFSMAADKGSAVGQAGLGMMYLYGKGVPKDYERALRYLTLAANQGLVDGQLELGNMFYNGLGVEKNFKMALKYYQQASKHGHVLAFYNMAMMHAKGIGTAKHCQSAMDGFKLVAERGPWSTKLVEAYQDYKGGRETQALVKYAFLAELGYEHAQSNAAFILDRSESSLFDRNASFARALNYWSRSAQQGYVVARLKLGDYHYYGFGTPVDFSTSAHHYRLAAEIENNPQAMFNLGYMHEQGYGMTKDIHLAKRYYDLAAITSVDAQVPVMLALLKMAIIYGVEYLNNFRWDNFGEPGFVMHRIFGPDWDLYLMSLLAALIAAMAYIRRLF